jgi:hypothetical protein
MKIDEFLKSAVLYHKRSEDRNVNSGIKIGRYKEKGVNSV